MQTSTSVVTPLAGFPVVTGSDPDALAAFAKTAFKPRSVLPIAGGRRNLIRQAKADDFSLSYGFFECGLDLDVGEQQTFYKIVLGLSGVSHLRQHDEEVALTPGVAVVKSATLPIKWQHGADAEALYLVISRDALERQLTGLTGRSLPTPIEFEPLVRKPSLVRLVQFLATEIDQTPSLVEQSIVTKTYAELVMRTLLTQQPHNYANWLTTEVKEPAPRQLRMAEEVLEAYADQPVMMEEVARAAGYSIRSMNRAFQRYRGCTPLEFLRDTRLERARRMLSTPGRARSVTDAALNCGYGNAGRFSILYRERFGESPSTTFKRANCP